MLSLIQSNSIFQNKKQKGELFQGYWKMSFDGACSKYGNGSGIVFKIHEANIHPHAIKLQFPCTNNDAKYEALIQGMIISLQMKVENLLIIGDSKLITNHIINKYKVKKENFKCYAKRVSKLMDSFNFFNTSFIPREKNQKDDALAASASLFNTEYCQGQGTYHVKSIFRPSIPDNQEYLQVFENDEHVVISLRPNPIANVNTNVLKMVSCFIYVEHTYFMA
jgi:ribonuclease HI